MTLLSLFGDDGPDEDALWIPDPNEETDLSLHARNCRKRWEVTLKIMRDVQRSTREVRLYLLIIIVLLAINSSPLLASFIQNALKVWLSAK